MRWPGVRVPSPAFSNCRVGLGAEPDSVSAEPDSRVSTDLRGCFDRRLLACRAIGNRDLDEERRALAAAVRLHAGVALDPDPAVQAADQLAADVEAEAGAADAA